MEKINVAELLKDCPSGMELDCTAFNNVKFQCADNDGIWIEYIDSDNHDRVIYLTCDGGIKIKNIETKCVIFPKGKTTWEGFQRPFKDGDIVASNSGSQVFIFKEYVREENNYAYCYVFLNDDGTVDFECDSYFISRLATEEEKQRLFDAIKANGYRWNSETKTLEKLIEPKFKVGDNWSAGYVVETDNLQPYKEETMEIPEKLMPKIDFNEYCKDKYILYLGNYEIKEENGKTYAVRKWLEYPKTYEECYEIMGIEYPVVGGKPDGLSASTYRITEIRPFIYLLICRDAYWKMAGEEMGLGKPWEPDWVNAIYTCTIICRSNKIVKDAGFDADNRILAFPTEEMRDAFYENFKDLIDNCKELL